MMKQERMPQGLCESLWFSYREKNIYHCNFAMTSNHFSTLPILHCWGYLEEAWFRVGRKVKTEIEMSFPSQVLVQIRVR